MRTAALVGCAVLLACGCRLARPPAYAPQAEQTYPHAAVAADHPAASQAGLEILKAGGNAVDAAVATSFCLSVVRPYSCGIGGGGFMLIYRPPRLGEQALSIAINYRETAPAAVGSDYYASLNDPHASRFGVHAVAVPGTVAGLCHVLERYGTLDLPTVLAPAIRLAEQGFAADAHFAAAVTDLSEDLRRYEAQPGVSRSAFLEMLGSDAVKPGDIVRNPDQARALKLIAKQGPDALYRGEIATAMLKLIKDLGGAMTADDLSSYRLREAEPLRGRFREHELLSMPPPSSGGIATQQILGIVERRALPDLPTGWPRLPDDPQHVHILAEAFKHAFADRAMWLADPEFVDVPVDRLLDPAYLDRLAAAIELERTLPPAAYGSIESPGVASQLQDGGTSHFCVIDPQGMAVACTETINLSFGSLVVVPGYGFFLNNEMDDFTTIPGQANAFGLRQSDRNLPQPGKRPLSSMSPTILLKDGRVALIAGGSGGPRIITAVVQAVLDCLMFDTTPMQALSAPRVHHQWMPNVLELEPGLAGSEVEESLKRRGHETRRADHDAQVQVIMVSPDGIRAASDPRKGGAPAGY